MGSCSFVVFEKFSRTYAYQIALEFTLSPLVRNIAGIHFW